MHETQQLGKFEGISEKNIKQIVRLFRNVRQIGDISAICIYKRIYLVPPRMLSINNDRMLLIYTGALYGVLKPTSLMKMDK